MRKNEIKFDKLVRDKIPKIILESNKYCKIHIADNLEYRDQLYKKLQEEVSEFLEAPCAEEIADILEVIDAIVAANKHHDIDTIKQSKGEQRGRFHDKIVLESVWSD